MEETAALLTLLVNEDGMSIHKACKKLGLSMSEMMRLLTALGPETLGGLDLVQREERAGRTCLFLTPLGRVASTDSHPETDMR